MRFSFLAARQVTVSEKQPPWLISTIRHQLVASSYPRLRREEGDRSVRLSYGTDQSSWRTSLKAQQLPPLLHPSMTRIIQLPTRPTPRPPQIPDRRPRNLGVAPYVGLAKSGATRNRHAQTVDARTFHASCLPSTNCPDGHASWNGATTTAVRLCHPQNRPPARSWIDCVI
jgi:hypothetical protein